MSVPSALPTVRTSIQYIGMSVAFNFLITSLFPSFLFPNGERCGPIASCSGYRSPILIFNVWVFVISFCRGSNILAVENGDGKTRRGIYTFNIDHYATSKYIQAFRYPHTHDASHMGRSVESRAQCKINRIHSERFRYVNYLLDGKSEPFRSQHNVRVQIDSPCSRLNVICL